MPRIRQQEQLLVQTFARLDAVALGLACGIVCGFGLFTATAVLLIKGGREIGPNLSLLSQSFLGYSVTWSGALIGALYSFLTGFIVGSTLAIVRNFVVAVYLHSVRLQAHLSKDDFLDL